MTKKKAEELLEEIIMIMETETQINGIPDIIEENILEECIDITVDELEEESIMILGKKPETIKMANVSMDIRKAIEIVLEVALTSAIPTDKLVAVKMILLVVLKILQLSRQSISEQMADVVLILDRLNAYRDAISIEYLKKYIAGNSLLPKSEYLDEIEDILDKLYNYKIIDINDDKVILKEKILFVR